MMRKMRIAVSALLLCIPAGASADPVASAVKSFTVTYANGKSEDYRYVYDADVKTASKETGLTADPIRARFIDTRHCGWTVQASVKRALYLVNQAGQQFQKGDPVEILTATSGYTVSSQAKQSCAAAAPAINAQDAAVRQKLKAQIAAIATEDFNRALPGLHDLFGTAVIAPKQ